MNIFSLAFCTSCCMLKIRHTESLTSSFLQSTCRDLQWDTPSTAIRAITSLSQATTDDSESETAIQEDAESTGTVYYSANRPLDESSFLAHQDDHLVEPDMPAPDTGANEYSFFDEATIYVRAGSGGQGASTFKKGKGGQDGPPDGGNGGRGGNVVMIMDESLNTLAGLTNAWRPNSFGGSGAAASTGMQNQRKSFRGENGADGGRQLKSGRYGKDVTIRVPPGTVVEELVAHEDGTEDVYSIGSIVENSSSLIVANGGEGGEGSGINKSRGVRRNRIPPEGGERKVLRLTLKIVADVALVGVPNAGKSTFLSAVTRAKPKIANYPFTTVIPNLGVWIPPSNDQVIKTGSQRSNEGSGSDGLVLCDVPGLIAGAAQGVGLGHAFLRHVERCHVILHLVDATSNDPVADFEMLNRELVNYGTGQLALMPQVVVVNKVDALEGRGEDWESGLKARLNRDDLETKLRDVMSHSRLMWMSAKEKEGVDDLMIRMAAFTKKVKGTSS